MKLGSTHHWYRMGGIALGLALAIGLAVLLCSSYSPSQFRGDGEIRDTGFWSYPRYHIRFPEVRLDQPGEYEFSCSGLPPVPLTFELSLSGDYAYEDLAKLATNVTFHMTDDRGSELCRGSGPLSHWVLRWGGVEDIGGFWHLDCRDAAALGQTTYTVGLTVKDVDAASPALSARPILKGGGNENP